VEKTTLTASIHTFTKLSRTEIL